ncbi:hypothetical protein LCGC14_2026330 [marine sediment metagenome]|uniref:Uncharacterized protein n=1 Tax=marine sediment metagenome TaxID=412755 RepID=A0A0F9EVY3_9ZZZZ
METKKFYYIKTDKDMIDLTLDILDSGPLSIIWNLSGMYTMLEKAAVENIVSLLEDQKRQRVQSPPYRIHWDDLYVAYEDDYIRLNRIIGCLTT